MKKTMISFVVISVFILLLVACTTEGKGRLTRVDVVIESQDYTHIQDKASLVLLENIFEQAQWEPSKVPDMTREADVKAIFLYEVEKNMPERLYEYTIWFNEDSGTAIIISDDKEEGCSGLDKDSTKSLKSIIF